MDKEQGTRIIFDDYQGMESAVAALGGFDPFPVP